LAKGISIGHPSSFSYGEFSVGIGSFTKTYGNNSVAIGRYVRTDLTAVNSIVIGSGVTGYYLNNNIPNSIFLGSNSNIPTLFIGAANGIGTYGKIGIGTSTPEDQLQIMTGIRKLTIGEAYSSDLHYGTSYIGFNASRTNAGWITSGDGAHNGGGIIYSTVHGHMYFVPVSSKGGGSQAPMSDVSIINNTNKMTLFSTGELGLGTECVPYGYKLAVDGKIVCEEVLVKLSDASGCWPDYVFDSTYQLKPLVEVEKFIIENKHLPEVPSAKEVVENGLTLSEMSKIQMKKIEELTLYLIELNKKMDFLQRENDNLKTIIMNK
jgi:hypothetical protein